MREAFVMVMDDNIYIQRTLKEFPYRCQYNDSKKKEKKRNNKQKENYFRISYRFALGSSVLKYGTKKWMVEKIKRGS